jgi:nitrite reductase/ring-hydroxylating ferredoxin subunit
MNKINMNYPQSWYPLCLSKQLKNGAIKVVQIFDQTLLVFRGESGAVAVISRHCPHMGTDLANGKVVKNSIRCPLHHWQFNQEGECQKVASAQVFQEDKILSFKVIEKYGIVYFFFGENILFDVPDTVFDDDYCYSKAQIAFMKNPYQAVTMNGFDAQHFQNVHNRIVMGDIKIESKSPFHLSINLAALVAGKNFYDRFMRLCGYNILDVKIESWGANLILVTNISGGYVALLSLLPHDDENSLMFITVMRRKRKTTFGRILQNVEMFFYSHLAHFFLKPDMAVLKNIKLEKRQLLQNKDGSVLRFWEYFDSLPKLSSTILSSGKW